MPGGGNNLQQNIGSQLGFGAPGGAMNFLQQFLQNPSSPANLLQQLGPAGSYANYGKAITPQAMTQGQGVAQQMGLGGVAATNPGLGVVSAYEPLFQKNLAQIQGSTPSARFSSGNQLAQTSALNDFNMFAQQALQQGLGQQISAALGSGQQQLQGAQGLGALQLGGQAQQLPLAQQFLSTLFGAGLPQGTAVGPSPLGQAAGMAGGIGALGTAMRGLGGQGGGGGGSLK